MSNLPIYFSSLLLKLVESGKVPWWYLLESTEAADSAMPDSDRSWGSHQDRKRLR